MSSRDGQSFYAAHILSGKNLLEGAYLNELDGTITSISEEPEFANIVELGPHSILFPGCVNTHGHSYLSLLKGSTNDCTTPQFLQIVYAALENFTPNDIYRGARLAFEEMAQNGITTVCDFFYLNGRGNENAEQAIRAAKDVGLRVVLNRCFIDNPKLSPVVVEEKDVYKERFAALRKKYDRDPTVRITPAAHSVYYTSEEGIRAVRDLAQQNQCKWFMHFGDSQGTRDFALEHFHMSEAQYLGGRGLIDANCVAVHAIWADEADVAVLARCGVAVSHNPTSNQFVGERVALVPEMLKAHILVGLGTDGGATNPSLSIFQEMRNALLMQKSRLLNPAALSVNDGLLLGTENGARIAGMRAGTLGPGYLADFLVCDTRHPTLQPVEKALSHFVYGPSARAITSTYVGGRRANCSLHTNNPR